MAQTKCAVLLPAGTAFIIDDKGGGETFLPFAYGTNTALQPGSRSLSARAHADVDEAGKFQLGGVLAARRYEGDRGDNNVLGPDFSWQINDAWRLKGQWLHSDTTAQPDHGNAFAYNDGTPDSIDKAMEFYSRDSIIVHTAVEPRPEKTSAAEERLQEFLTREGTGVLASIRTVVIGA